MIAKTIIIVLLLCGVVIAAHPAAQFFMAVPEAHAVKPPVIKATAKPATPAPPVVQQQYRWYHDGDPRFKGALRAGHWEKRCNGKACTNVWVWD